MKLFSWVTKDTTIDFMRGRKLGYVLSILMVVLSCACIAVKGFNYGIDFSGGITWKSRLTRKLTLKQ